MFIVLTMLLFNFISKFQFSMKQLDYFLIYFLLWSLASSSSFAFRQTSSFLILRPSAEIGCKSVLLNRIPSNFTALVCPYQSHCSHFCQCCEFDACDCEMLCPDHCSCHHGNYWETNIVDCSGNKNSTTNAVLNQVPAQIPMDVSDLILDGQHLHTLAPLLFIGRKKMRALYLNNSFVHHISNRTFKGLALLQFLHLQHNSLSRLDGYEFEDLGSLHELHLEYNQLQFISENTFENLRSLQILRLEHNRLIQLHYRQMTFQLPLLHSLSSLVHR